jgi:hypothetical protein
MIYVHTWLDNAIQNVVAGNGIRISISAMCIVFAALAMISLFIAGLPHILKVVARVLPEEKPTGPAPVDGQIVAAIACVLHKRKYGKPD